MANVVITGTNRGIGLQLVKQYQERGEHVIAACRSKSAALAVCDVEIYEGLDVSDTASVNKFAQSIGDLTIDILINNAGILTRETLDDMDWDRIQRQFEVNTLGPLKVTTTLLPKLKDGSKVGIVSSRVGSLADNGSGGNYGYRMSKSAVNMAGVNLALDLKPKGIPVMLLHPGYVRTEMTGGHGNIDAADAARGLIARMDELTLANAGTFWHAEGYELPW